MPTQDFNPLDLSAYAQKPAPTKKDEKKKAKQANPQVVVRRVSIGPLLHSRFSKLFAFLALLFFLAFSGYAATQWWLLNR